MFSTKIKKIISFIFIFIVVLFLGLFVYEDISIRSILNNLDKKVDINVYFTTTALEEEIFSIKDSLENLSEVASVEYVSSEQALILFKERSIDDPLTLQALENLGKNPLGAILNIQAKETNQYETIINFLENYKALYPEGIQIIDKVNYSQDQTGIVIDRLSRISFLEKIELLRIFLLWRIHGEEVSMEQVLYMYRTR